MYFLLYSYFKKGIFSVETFFIKPVWSYSSTNSATQSNKRPQLYEVVAIIGELQGYEDYFLSNCLINNKEYLIYFYPQYITNALQEAIRLKKATNIYVYKKEKNILFYKLAAPKK